MAILPDLSQKTPDELRAMILAMAAAPSQKLTIKVSVKGAVSVFGLGRWPTTLYATQWERLLADAPRILAFIKANQAALATKPQAD
jgi:predicted esterase